MHKICKGQRIEGERGGRRQRTPCHKGGCAAAHVFDTIHTTKTADKCCIQQTTTITTTTTTSSVLRLNNCNNNGVQRVAASASACNSLLSAASASAVVVVKLCHVAHVRSMKIHFCFFGACNSTGSIIFTCISIKTHTHTMTMILLLLIKTIICNLMIAPIMIVLVIMIIRAGS